MRKEIKNNGQGNPYVTTDNKFLFYTTGEHLKTNCRVNGVDIQSELENN